MPAVSESLYRFSLSRISSALKSIFRTDMFGFFRLVNSEYDESELVYTILEKGLNALTISKGVSMSLSENFIRARILDFPFFACTKDQHFLGSEKIED